MDIIAKMLSPSVNYGVVQMPGRQFPGVVVQGDSLNEIVQNLKRAKVAFSAGDLDEALACLDLVINPLEGALTGYERVCAQHEIQLPYFRST